MKLKDIIEVHKYSKADGRDYERERKFNDTPKARAYRAKLNKYNRDKGTYGNDDGKDASHKDEKIVGTYFFSSEKSENSTIKENKKVIPGKWRSCEINLTKKKHTYSVELLDKGKTVYIRCLGIK